MLQGFVEVLQGRVYPVRSLDGPDQSDSSPHVHVAVERSRVRHLVFGSGNAQDGLQVTRLPKDPSLWRQSIPTQGPELYTQAQKHARARRLVTLFHTRGSVFRRWNPP